MAILAVQQIVDSGLAPAYSAAAGAGDTFVNDGSGRQFLHVIDAGDGVVVTIAPDVTTTTKPGFGTLTRASMVVTIGSAAEKFIGPFPLTAFGVNPDIQYDSETSVTLAVLKI